MKRDQFNQSMSEFGYTDLSTEGIRPFTTIKRLTISPRHCPQINALKTLVCRHRECPTQPFGSLLDQRFFPPSISSFVVKTHFVGLALPSFHGQHQVRAYTVSSHLRTCYWYFSTWHTVFSYVVAVRGTASACQLWVGKSIPENCIHWRGRHCHGDFTSRNLFIKKNWTFYS